MADDQDSPSERIELVERLEDIQPENRMEELDPFWFQIDNELPLHRFVYNDTLPNEYGSLPVCELHRPILHIHGFRSSYLTWNSLVLTLWKMGFRNLFALELHSYDRGINDLTTEIREAIDLIKDILPTYKTVHVIAHSLGGIVTRYYLKSSGSDDPNVRLCITLAAPHNGMFHLFKPIESLFIKFMAGVLNTTEDLIGVFSPSEKGMLAEVNKSITTKEFFNITYINISGSVKKLGGTDGTFKPALVPDMINIVVNENHFSINKAQSVFNIIHELLFNEVIIYKLRLVYIENKLYSENKQPRKIFFQFQSDQAINQRFPVDGTIHLDGEDYVPEVPFQLFTGMKHNSKQSQLWVNVLEQQTLRAKSIGSGTIIPQIREGRSMLDYITLNISNGIQITLNLFVYRLGLEKVF